MKLQLTPLTGTETCYWCGLNSTEIMKKEEFNRWLKQHHGKYDIEYSNNVKNHVNGKTARGYLVIDTSYRSSVWKCIKKLPYTGNYTLYTSNTLNYMFIWISYIYRKLINRSANRCIWCMSRLFGYIALFVLYSIYSTAFYLMYHRKEKTRERL